VREDWGGGRGDEDDVELMGGSGGSIDISGLAEEEASTWARTWMTSGPTLEGGGGDPAATT